MYSLKSPLRSHKLFSIPAIAMSYIAKPVCRCIREFTLEIPVLKCFICSILFCSPALLYSAVQFGLGSVVWKLSLGLTLCSAVWSHSVFASTLLPSCDLARVYSALLSFLAILDYNVFQLSHSRTASPLLPLLEPVYLTVIYISMELNDIVITAIVAASHFSSTFATSRLVTFKEE
jgi:hypothetical protein